MMEHLISEKLGLSHQADHEYSENYHPLTYKYAPEKEKGGKVVVSNSGSTAAKESSNVNK
jgi:hypothetical protein